MSRPSRRTSAGRNRCKPSKYGNARPTSRGNALSPQPVSRVPSRRIAPRTALATRDWNFLKPVALRPTRWPAIRPMLRRALLQRLDQLGQECRIVLAVAVERDDDRRRAPRAMPVRSAADCPQDCACLTWRSHGCSARKRVELRFGAVGRAVVDVDHLEAATGQRRRDLRHQRRDIAGLVPDRNDDGHGGRSSWKLRLIPRASRQRASGGQAL